MQADLFSRLLFHACLALAGACLACAELPFLPMIPVALAVYLALVGLAAWAEGRWCLPAWAANLLGVGVAVAAVAWALGFARGHQEWSQDVPLTAVMVPYLGPVTMALLAVRLFRPRRRADFWILQGMGLLQVGLGCVLATGPLFGGLLLAYLVTTLALVLEHDRRSAPGRAAGRPSAARLCRRALVWAAAVAGVAGPLYLVTPRGETSEWDPFHRFGARKNDPAPARTGHGEEIDLNRIGPLSPDDSVAFRVQAAGPDGGPAGLPPDQRWRGMTLPHYEAGKWSNPALAAWPFHGPEAPGPRHLPAGPGSVTLTFTVQPERAGGLFLADPVRLGPRPGMIPVQSLDGPRPPLFFEKGGAVLPIPYLVDQSEFHYRQVIEPADDRDRYPVLPVRFDLDAGDDFVAPRLPGLGPWTYDLLRRLGASPPHRGPGLKLPERPAGAGDEVRLPERHWEAAARLLTDYLTHSGHYAYSLNARRADPRLDPVLDFLWNVREGACERYAASLALMLRAVGVPARLVRGFRGAEQQGSGQYVVRQSQAHAWVEAWVPRGDPRQAVFDWVVLDPTPAGEAPPPPGFSLSRLFGSGGEELWRELFLNYNADAQAGLWTGLTSPERMGGPLAAGLGLALALPPALWWLRRRSRRGTGERRTPYRLLVALLARHAGPRPHPGQTPREFAAAVGELLAYHPEAAPLAGLPLRVVERYYAGRFGGHPTDPAVELELKGELEALGRLLGRRPLAGRKPG